MGRRLTGLALVLAAHVAAAWLLLQVESVRQAVREATPLMISLVAPEEAPPAKPTEPPKPRPVARQPVAPKPVAEAPLLTTPAAWTVPPTAAQAPPPVPAAAAPAPAPVTAPVFDADYLHNPAPAHPPQSRRMGEQGMVVLRVHVSAAGVADQVEVESSSGFARLDQAALAAVQTWQFVPARQGDKPVAAWVAVPLHFKLGG